MVAASDVHVNVAAINAICILSSPKTPIPSTGNMSPVGPKAHGFGVPWHIGKIADTLGLEISRARESTTGLGISIGYSKQSAEEWLAF